MDEWGEGNPSFGTRLWAHRPALFTLAASIDRENVSILCCQLWLHQLLILSVLLLLLLFPVHLVALFRVIIYFISLLLLRFTVCRENLVTTARKGHQWWWWCFALCNRRPFIFFFVVEASVTPCFDPVCPVELSNYVLSRQCDTEHPEFQSVSQSG